MKRFQLSAIAALLAAMFSLTISARATDKDTILYSFLRGKGWNPQGTLLMDSSGNFFGANLNGGSANSGTIFELTPKGGGFYNYAVIYDCASSPSCSAPLGPLVMDAAGNLYGSTLFGEVFELTYTGGVWTAANLYEFGVSGAPSTVILDPAGNLYGTSGIGGSASKGFVFELSPASGGVWTFTDIHDFTGPDGDESGCCTYAGLIIDPSGNLYGTTGSGGSSSACTSGCGVVFELTNNAGAWTETVLHSFTGTDGSAPSSPLLMTPNGNLYGSTASSGPGGFGTAFEMRKVSGVWQTGTIHAFSGGADGATPNTALVRDALGNLYGTTLAGGGGGGECISGGGITGCGTAFELTCTGSGWEKTLLHPFSGLVDGAFPGGLIVNGSGNLFGVAPAGGHLGWGVAFELSPK